MSASKFFDAAYDILIYGMTALITAVAAGAWWLIRRVFLNQAQIEILQREMAHRDFQRAEQRAADKAVMADLRDDIHQARASIEKMNDAILKSIRNSNAYEDKKR